MPDGSGADPPRYLDMERYPGGDPDLALEPEALLDLHDVLWRSPIPPPAIPVPELVERAVVDGADGGYANLLPATGPEPEPEEVVDRIATDDEAPPELLGDETPFGEPWQPEPADPGPDEPGWGEHSGNGAVE